MAYLTALFEISGLNILLALSVFATLMVGQFSLAQVGFWSIGAFVSAMLTTMYGFPLFSALLISGIICAVIGVALGYPCLRIKGIYLTLATVAFAEVVRVFFSNLHHQVEIDGQMVGPAGALGFRGVDVIAAWPEIFAVVLVVIGLFFWIERSRIGLSANAIREDETAAAAMGINVVLVKVSMFAFGAAIAGVGGGLYATFSSFVLASNFSFHLALISIFYVAVGGMYRFYGPIVGAILLTALPETFRFASDYRMILYGVVVLIVVAAFPRGIVDEILFRLGERRERNRVRDAQRGASSGSDATIRGES
ncbi:MAG: branched-chain amino acid ABC transporter permease [Alphaproteobacteria bacterium]|nr:branched-chain amino acid ABC transporter permease [Alphaproteobacteria bacterium]